VNFRVRDTATGTILPGFPSPYLIGLAGSVEAYTETPDDPNPYWYAHVPGRYESKDGTYKRVRIEKVEDWAVRLQIEVIDESYHPGDPDAPEPYTDRFIVKAGSRHEAEELAMAEARKDVEDRYDSFDATNITILGAREGESI
jgi:hypothetical protein